MTRRTFGTLWAAAAGASLAPALTACDLGSISGPAAADPQSSAPVAPLETLQSELLLDLVLDKGPTSNVGSPGMNRVVVQISGGTFEGPRLKGTLVGPGGDWIVARPDGSSVLDIRVLLRTDDEQNIYMASRGIAYTPPGGALYARILPVFETGATKYLWLNNVVAVGVYRPMPEKVAYRIYRIL